MSLLDLLHGNRGHEGLTVSPPPPRSPHPAAEYRLVVRQVGHENWRAQVYGTYINHDMHRVWCLLVTYHCPTQDQALRVGQESLKAEIVTAREF